MRRARKQLWTWPAWAVGLVFVLLTIACHRGQTATTTVTIEGHIDGLSSDTLLIYGVDRLYDRIDTAYTDSTGRFSLALASDTLIHAYLLLPDGGELPLLFDRGDHLQVAGRVDSLTELSVSGNAAHAALHEFCRQLTDSLATLTVDSTTVGPTDSLTLNVAEAYIRLHPHSPASLHLLHRYFVDTDRPDADRILALCYALAGELKDRPYVEALISRLEEDNKVNSAKAIYNLSLPNAEGERVSRADFRDKYLLIHVWASWDSASRAANAIYRRLYRAERRNEHVAMVGISLDSDSAAWQQAVKEDTLKWTQVIARGGWCADIVSQYGLHRLPANLLINANGKLEARDLAEDELRQRVRAIDEEEKAKEERRKRRSKK